MFSEEKLGYERRTHPWLCDIFSPEVCRPDPEPLVGGWWHFQIPGRQIVEKEVFQISSNVVVLITHICHFFYTGKIFGE